MNTLSISLILTCLWLCKRQTALGHLIHSWPQCLQKTHRKHHWAPNKPERRGKGTHTISAYPLLANEQEVKWGTKSISMIMHFNLLPWALAKKVCITQLAGIKQPLSVSPHHTCYSALKVHSARYKEMWYLARHAQVKWSAESESESEVQIWSNGALKFQ